MPDLFVVWDKKARAMLGHAFPSRSDDEAARMFLGLAQNKETLVSQFPDDFELWCLGRLAEGGVAPALVPSNPALSSDGAHGATLVASARSVLDNAR